MATDDLLRVVKRSNRAVSLIRFSFWQPLLSLSSRVQSLNPPSPQAIPGSIS